MNKFWFNAAILIAGLIVGCQAAPAPQVDAGALLNGESVTSDVAGLGDVDPFAKAELSVIQGFPDEVTWGELVKSLGRPSSFYFSGYGYEDKTNGNVRYMIRFTDERYGIVEPSDEIKLLAIVEHAKTDPTSETKRRIIWPKYFIGTPPDDLGDLVDPLRDDIRDILPKSTLDMLKDFIDTPNLIE